ncbi:uncharacterized protein LOC126212073 [Schistocerca nitens]|uniref:uncharacterized protein LOC126212073 n=1 Tax=Schistocerca nitens TaxID=7011 RepID=UPI0021187910|nr:uncharacterized protein LOC126212073 [Schistocerca nitens]
MTEQRPGWGHSLFAGPGIREAATAGTPKLGPNPGETLSQLRRCAPEERPLLPGGPGCPPQVAAAHFRRAGSSPPAAAAGSRSCAAACAGAEAADDLTSPRRRRQPEGTGRQAEAASSSAAAPATACALCACLGLTCRGAAPPDHGFIASAGPGLRGIRGPPATRDAPAPSSVSAAQHGSTDRPVRSSATPPEQHQPLEVGEGRSLRQSDAFTNPINTASGA